MENSRKNYICITSSYKVKKYANQSVSQIIEKKEDYSDKFISISISISNIELYEGEDEFEKVSMA